MLVEAGDHLDALRAVVDLVEPAPQEPDRVPPAVPPVVDEGEDHVADRRPAPHPQRVQADQGRWAPIQPSQVTPARYTEPTWTALSSSARHHQPDTFGHSRPGRQRSTAIIATATTATRPITEDALTPDTSLSPNWPAGPIAPTKDADQFEEEPGQRVAEEVGLAPPGHWPTSPPHSSCTARTCRRPRGRSPGARRMRRGRRSLGSARGPDHRPAELQVGTYLPRYGVEYTFFGGISGPQTRWRHAQIAHDT